MPPAAKKVLIADDNRDAADTLAIVLEHAGYHTAIAYGGQEALDVAALFQPDIAILDINMPGVDGYAVARGLRQSTGKLRKALLVALTALQGAVPEARAQEAGFDVHLRKPVAGAELVEMLQRARRRR
jgi:CheY-like chemotaxis protein